MMGRHEIPRPRAVYKHKKEQPEDRVASVRDRAAQNCRRPTQSAQLRCLDGLVVVYRACRELLEGTKRLRATPEGHEYLGIIERRITWLEGDRGTLEKDLEKNSSYNRQ